MIHKMTEADKKRFWDKVDKSGDCWLWTTGLQTKGYGQFELNRGKRTAHRLSYMLCIGPIPTGLLVCHNCNVKHCVNPEHLYLATNQQNCQDAGKDGLLSHKNRKVKFPRNVKLSEKQLIYIRKLFATGNHFMSHLAGTYNVSDKTIADIVKEKSWKYLLPMSGGANI